MNSAVTHFTTRLSLQYKIQDLLQTLIVYFQIMVLNVRKTKLGPCFQIYILFPVSLAEWTMRLVTNLEVADSIPGTFTILNVV